MQQSINDRMNWLAGAMIYLDIYRTVMALPDEMRLRLEPYELLVLESVSNHVKCFEEFPDADHWAKIVVEQLNKLDDELRRNEIATSLCRAYTNIEQMRKADPDKGIAAAKQSLADRLNELSTSAITIAAAEGATVDQLQSILSADKAAISAIEIDTDSRIEEPSSRSQQLVKIGIEFLDAAFQGFAPGSVIGHVAPVNECKTTLALQVVGAQLEQDSHKCSYYVSYEDIDSIGPEIASSVARIPRTRCFAFYSKNRDPKCLTVAEYERYQHCLANRFNRVGYANMMNAKLEGLALQGVRGIEAFITAHQSRRGNPGVGVIVVDYLGFMLSIWQYESQHSVQRRPTDEKLIREAVSELRQLAVKHSCLCWVAHQASGEGNRCHRGGLPPATAQGSRLFNERFSHVLHSGRLTADGHAAWQITKSRTQRVDDRIRVFRLDPVYAGLVASDRVFANGMVQPSGGVSDGYGRVPGFGPRVEKFGSS